VVAKRTDGRANGVEFVDAFGPGTNLVYDVFTDGVKESIVLNKAPKAAPVFRFPVDVEGLSWRTNTDGAFEFYDNAGTVQFTIPTAFAYDSRGGQDTPGNAYVHVKTELIADAKGLVLVVSPSLAWLTSPQRVYPVVIDPTIQMQPWNPMNLGYMPWGDNSGGTQFSAWTNDMLFGNWWGSNWASYIQFDPNLFSGKLINNATLNLRVQNCDNQSNPAAPYANPIHVRQLTSVYWFGQGWPGPNHVGDVAVQPAGPSTALAANITAMAQAWAANPAANFGLRLDMGNAAGYCRVQRTTSANQPTYVEVTYNEPPIGVSEAGALKNFSFETGTSPWSPCYRSEYTTWSLQTGGAQNGSKFLRFRTDNNTDGSSICQTVPYEVGPGNTYTLTAYVKSANGSPVSGRLLVWEGGNNPVNGYTDFTVGGTWTPITVQRAGAYASNMGLRAEILHSTPYTADLDVDNVMLTVTSGPTVISNLYGGQWLSNNGMLRSPNWAYAAIMQGDGNFVIYNSAMNPEWWTGTWTAAGNALVMQNDGNLVVYNYLGQPVWNTGTWCNQGLGVYLTMQNDGNLVLYRGNGVPIWSRYTGILQNCVVVPPPPPPNTPDPNASDVWVQGGAKLIANGASGRCLIPVEKAGFFGRAIEAGSCNSGAAQQWSVTDLGGGYFRVQSSFDLTLCLDVDLYGPADGARVQLGGCNGMASQQFQITQAGTQYWRFASAAHPGSCLDEDLNPSLLSNGNFVVHHYICNGRANQTWYPVYVTVGNPSAPDGVLLYPDYSGMFVAEWYPSSGATHYLATVTDQVTGFSETKQTSAVSALFAVNPSNLQKLSVVAVSGSLQSAPSVDFAKLECSVACEPPDDLEPGAIDGSTYEPGATIEWPFPPEPEFAQAQAQGAPVVTPSRFAQNPLSVCWGTGNPGAHAASTQVGRDLIYNVRVGKIMRVKIRCGDNRRGVNHIAFRTTNWAQYGALNKHFGRVFDAETLSLIRYVFSPNASPQFPLASKSTNPVNGYHVLTRKTGCLQRTGLGVRVLWSRQVRVIVDPISKEVVSAYFLGNGPEDRTPFALLYPQNCRGLAAPV
jgi:hypothetical protein